MELCCKVSHKVHCQTSCVYGYNGSNVLESSLAYDCRAIASLQLTDRIPSNIPNDLLPAFGLHILLDGNVGPTLSHHRSEVLESALLLLARRARVWEEADLRVLGLHVLDESWRCLGCAHPDDA